MEAIARIKEIKTSPRKIRLVADAIRSMGVMESLDALSVTNKKGAADLENAMKSAIANAVNNLNLSKDNLMIKSIDVSEGTSLKRFRPSTRGRVHKYKKRTSTIRIVLSEKVMTQLKAEDRKKDKEEK